MRLVEIRLLAFPVCHRFFPDYTRGVGVDMEKAFSFRSCSRFVVSTVYPRLEINEFSKLVATSGELPQRANQTLVVVNNSGLVVQRGFQCVFVFLCKRKEFVAEKPNGCDHHSNK